MSIILKKIIRPAFLLIMFISSPAIFSAPSTTVAWLNANADFSTRKILENISPDDGLKGSVIAAKSRANPDYYYHWVRDAALTMTALIDAYQSIENEALRKRVREAVSDYLDFSIYIQTHSPAPGEPKFYVNGNVYEKPWGRPQNDGPALRAISLIHWANILIAEGKEDIVDQKIYRARLPADSIVKKDLEYISHHWKDASFDIWEEVKGSHFYTLMVTRRALLEGAALAERLDDKGAARWYHLQAKEIEIELENFWDNNKNYFIATINRTDGADYKSSNLDVSVLLGLLHGNLHDGFLAWDDPRILATVEKIISTFSHLYPVNHSRHIPGTAIGRYPEDRYGGDNFDGGNPWVITTLAVAEVLYEVANALRAQGHQQTALSTAHHADKFVERIKFHANADGTLDEQIHRVTGTMTSAKDLTWNYAALLTTRRAASTN